MTKNRKKLLGYLYVILLNLFLFLIVSIIWIFSDDSIGVILWIIANVAFVVMILVNRVITLLLD
jgi:hypothetical protein